MNLNVLLNPEEH